MKTDRGDAVDFGMPSVSGKLTLTRRPNRSSMRLVAETIKPFVLVTATTYRDRGCRSFAGYGVERTSHDTPHARHNRLLRRLPKYRHTLTPIVRQKAIQPSGHKAFACRRYLWYLVAKCRLFASLFATLSSLSYLSESARLVRASSQLFGIRMI